MGAYTLENIAPDQEAIGHLQAVHAGVTGYAPSLPSHYRYPVSRPCTLELQAVPAKFFTLRLPSLQALYAEAIGYGPPETLTL